MNYANYTIFFRYGLLLSSLFCDWKMSVESHGRSCKFFYFHAISGAVLIALISFVVQYGISNPDNLKSRNLVKKFFFWNLTKLFLANLKKLKSDAVTLTKCIALTLKLIKRSGPKVIC